MKLIFFLSELAYDIPYTEEACKQKLKEEFRRNSTVRDLRVIDMLIIKVRIMYMKDIIIIDEYIKLCICYVRDKWIFKKWLCYGKQMEAL